MYHIYPTMMNHVTYPLSSADTIIFSPEINQFYFLKKYSRYSFPFWYIITNSFNFSWVIKDFFKKYGQNLDDVSKTGYPRPSWNNSFLKNGYGAIIFVHDVTNKILSHDSNYNVNVVMRTKFGNSDISMREVNITSIL